MPPDTSMVQVMAHILNPSCSNADCPNAERATAATKKSQQKHHVSASSGYANSVWKAELRVRYVPRNLRDLYERDRTTCHFYFDQVKQDYIQKNQSAVDQDTAVQMCCLAIRHYYKDTNQSSDKKHHVDYIEKEMGFSNFVPKSVIDAIKQKNLKKLIQAGYKKVYNYTEMEYMLKFFDLLRSQHTFDQEQFIVTLGSGWNIPVDLVIGPHSGISYVTHPQAKPTRVTDFQNIERITTSMKEDGVCATSTTTAVAGRGNLADGVDSVTNSPVSTKKSDKKATAAAAAAAAASSGSSSTSACNCHDIKTQLKIKVTGNAEDLAITCNGVKTAESIADLVDGYCRIVNNSDLSLWDRIASARNTPSASATNSLEKSQHHVQLRVKEDAQPSISTADSMAAPLDVASATVSDTAQAHSLSASSTSENSVSAAAATAAATSSTTSISLSTTAVGKPMLSEDYAEIGMGEEEGDYSTPAARNYELDRTQIQLNDIIGVGQFGDVHIGTCRVKQHGGGRHSRRSDDYSTPHQADDELSLASSNGSGETSADGAKQGNGTTATTIHVAVKTCKADADITVSEKFLEEACE